VYLAGEIWQLAGYALVFCAGDWYIIENPVQAPVLQMDKELCQCPRRGSVQRKETKVTETEPPMRVRLQKVQKEREEVIIRYREMTPEIENIIRYAEGREEKISAVKDGQQYMIKPREVIYLESVDGGTYIYTREEVYRTGLTLAQAEAHYGREGFFRCSKAMVINIYRIARLKSQPENRIDATMDNGEHVLISRRYAKELRSILKGGAL